MGDLNEKYKHQHKPTTNSDKAKFKQGWYVPKLHPEKCLTKENIYRSSWELAFYDWCDRSDNVVRWASEPIGIQYKNPIANLDYCNKHHLNPQNPAYWKVCTYNVDVWIELLTPDGTNVRKIFIEIKPYAQTKPPEPLKPDANPKQIKAWNEQARTYMVNVAKWKAAEEYFKSKQCEFMIVTERTLKQWKLIH